MSTEVHQPRRGLRSVIPYFLLFVLALGSGLAVWLSTGSPTSHVGPEGVLIFNVPDLTSSSTTLSGRSVDGISCRTEAKETVKYHVHVHVAVYVNGKMLRLPAGIGITKPQLVEHEATGVMEDVGIYDCLYWFHTHATDGIIHVEAPTKQNFTLGQFFDIWNQPLGPTRVGPAKGTVIAFENGKQIKGNPRSIPLLPHAVIQLDVGSPVVPFQSFSYQVAGGCGQGTNSCKPSNS